MNEEHQETKTTIDTEYKSIMKNQCRTQPTADEIDDFPYFPYARSSGRYQEDGLDGSVSSAQSFSDLVNGLDSAREALVEAFDVTVENFLLICGYDNNAVADDLRVLTLEDDARKQWRCAPGRYLEIWADEDEMVVR